MSQNQNHLNHSTWECKYHVVFTPRLRKMWRVKARNFLGHKLWARGYFVSTVGRDEEKIRADIKNQEIADQQVDQLHLKLASS